MSQAYSISSKTSSNDNAYSRFLWNVAASYVEVCHYATINDFVFNNFRQHTKYTKILEHVTYEQGWQYIEQIKMINRIDLLQDKQKIQQNDSVGNPKTYEYNEFGTFSPTTLRYVKVASELKHIFSTLHDQQLSICEIGVGYGGQCRILQEYFDIKNYTLIDITPAINLAKRYLENFSLKCKVDFITLNEIDCIKSDLCISNYAFSELNRGLQDVYYEKVIQHASHGYMTYNHISPKHFNTYTVYEFSEIVKHNAKISDEMPNSCPENRILVWGNADVAA